MIHAKGLVPGGAATVCPGYLDAQLWLFLLGWDGWRGVGGPWFGLVECAKSSPFIFFFLSNPPGSLGPSEDRSSYQPIDSSEVSADPESKAHMTRGY